MNTEPCRHSPFMTRFAWAESDKTDEVPRNGLAEWLNGGAIDIAFLCYNGEELVLKAKSRISSTAC